MGKTGAGTCRWSYIVRLYRDWGALKSVLLAFAIEGAVLSVPGLFLRGWKSAVVLLAVLLALGTLAYYVGAWFQRGVDDWSYEMDKRGITGETTVHHLWRAKLFRNLPTGKNWTVAKDFPKKSMEVAFSKVKTVSSDKQQCKIVLETSGCNGRGCEGVSRAMPAPWDACGSRSFRRGFSIATSLDVSCQIVFRNASHFRWVCLR